MASSPPSFTDVLPVLLAQKATCNALSRADHRSIRLVCKGATEPADAALMPQFEPMTLHLNALVGPGEAGHRQLARFFQRPGCGRFERLAVTCYSSTAAHPHM